MSLLAGTQQAQQREPISLRWWCICLFTTDPHSHDGCTARRHGFDMAAAIFSQLIDDVLDYTGSSSILGKPALNDLASGIATAPALFAAQEQPVNTAADVCKASKLHPSMIAHVSALPLWASR
jgi:Polyprenyl synthetase